GAGAATPPAPNQGEAPIDWASTSPFETAADSSMGSDAPFGTDTSSGADETVETDTPFGTDIPFGTDASFGTATPAGDPFAPPSSTTSTGTGTAANDYARPDLPEPSIPLTRSTEPTPPSPFQSTEPTAPTPPSLYQTTEPKAPTPPSPFQPPEPIAPGQGQPAEPGWAPPEVTPSIFAAQPADRGFDPAANGSGPIDGSGPAADQDSWTPPEVSTGPPARLEQALPSGDAFETGVASLLNEPPQSQPGELGSRTFRDEEATSAGLVKRQRGASHIPIGEGRPVSAAKRDPEEVRSRLSRYREGLKGSKPGEGPGRQTDQNDTRDR
ncbi:MAG: hypothetical protein ACR2QK_20715, partial [Acidimicrobiales bacterium]